MSFLTEFALRRAAFIQVPRATLAIAPRAAFSTSIALRRTPVETVKDGLKTVDRAVSDKIVDGIDLASTFV